MAAERASVRASTALSAEHMSRPRLIASTVGVLLGLLLAALDQTIVGTAMPRIVAELQGLDRYTWVLTAYLVTSTTMTPIAGKLGDLFGRKPFLLAGMIGFIAASALCGQSQDMTQLIVFRGVQGVFGGTLFATVFTVLADLFPPQQRARMQGLFGGIFGLSSVLGPTVGGYLTDAVGWRWVFYVNLPIGIAAVLIVLLAMPGVKHTSSWRDIDFAGAFTLAAGLTPLLVALSITRDHDWTSPQVLGLLGVAVVMLSLFWIAERRTDHPIVPFSLFKMPTFRVAVIVSLFVAFGMFGSIIFVPLLFQGVLGISAANSGQLLIPMMVGLIGGSLVSGQLITRVRRYRFIGTAGILIMSTGLFLLSFITPDSQEIEVVRDIVLVGLGLGTTMPLYINAVQSSSPPEVLGVVSSQIQFWRNVGGTVGSAILGSIFAHRLPQRMTEATAKLDLPPQFRALLQQQGGGDPQSIFDPAKIAATRAALPPQLAPLFDQVLHAIRSALAASLGDLFLFSVGFVLVAAVASLFLVDVPLRGRLRVRPVSEDVPVEEGIPAGTFGE